MAYLNANIPVEYAQIKREYLYDLKKHHGEVEDCIIRWTSFSENTIRGAAGGCVLLAELDSIRRGWVS